MVRILLRILEQLSLSFNDPFFSSLEVNDTMADDDDLRRLDQRIDQVTDETLDSTRRMLRVAEETNQIGVDTLVTLNEQGQLQ